MGVEPFGEELAVDLEQHRVVAPEAIAGGLAPADLGGGPLGVRQAEHARAHRREVGRRGLRATQFAQQAELGAGGFVRSCGDGAVAEQQVGFRRIAEHGLFGGDHEAVIEEA